MEYFIPTFQTLSNTCAIVITDHATDALPIFILSQIFFLILTAYAMEAKTFAVICHSTILYQSVKIQLSHHCSYVVFKSHIYVLKDCIHIYEYLFLKACSMRNGTFVLNKPEKKSHLIDRYCYMKNE